MRVGREEGVRLLPVRRAVSGRSAALLTPSMGCVYAPLTRLLCVLHGMLLIERGPGLSPAGTRAAPLGVEPVVGFALDESLLFEVREQAE